MNMYIRPSRRAKCNIPRVTEPPREGSFLHNIISKSHNTNFYGYKRDPVYNQSAYLIALKKNNEEMGIPYIDPKLPNMIPIEIPPKIEEPELLYVDRVQVKLRVLKTGLIRIKINTSIATLYEKYYKYAKIPPIKVIIQAYKSHGFSTSFTDKIMTNHEKRVIFATKVPKILEKIFDKEPMKKIKRMKAPPKPKEEVEEVPEEEPDEEEDNIPEEEGQMDVEPNIEDEEVVEEEYFSEPET